MQAMTFGVMALGWALASWVYFDATERGKRYPWIWALLVLFFGWSLLPEVVYLAVRNQGARLEMAEHVGVRQYLVTTSFTTMALTVAGASTAMASALVWAVSDQLSSNDLRDLLASSLAALVIGAALWVPHWSRIGHQLEGEMPDREFRSLYGLRRTELLTSIFLFGGIAALTALWVLGGALSALLQATYAGATGWLPVLGPALFCGAAAAYHAAYYRRFEGSEQARRFASLGPAALIQPPPHQVPLWTPTPAGTPWRPPGMPNVGPPPYGSYGAPVTAGRPPAEEGVRPLEGSPVTPSPGLADGSVTATPAAAFCGRCGARSATEDRFCRACGARLVTPPGATAA